VFQTCEEWGADLWKRRHSETVRVHACTLHARVSTPVSITRYCSALQLVRDRVFCWDTDYPWTEHTLVIETSRNVACALLPRTLKWLSGGRCLHWTQPFFGYSEVL
jgi:hypothetical protein